MASNVALATWVHRWILGKSWKSPQSPQGVEAARSHAQESRLNSVSEEASHSLNASFLGSGSLENNPSSPMGSRPSSFMGDRSSHHSKAAARYVMTVDPDLPRWQTRALERPKWEPPILDYREFEEGGRMYDSLNRHPDTKPEEWYAYTDAEVETELLGDYHDWIFEARREAGEGGNAERWWFYDELSREVDVERVETDRGFATVKETMFQVKRSARALPTKDGKRVQELWDPVRKRYKVVDSDDSEWDELEAEIFGNETREQTTSSQYAITRSNLRRAARSIYSYDEVSIAKVLRDVEHVHPGSISFFDEMFVPFEQQREARTNVDEREVEEYRVRRWGLMSCFGCCYG